MSAGGNDGGSSGGSAELVAMKGELEAVREQLRRSEEEQLGAVLRARRKEKALREMQRKQGGAAF